MPELSKDPFGDDMARAFVFGSQAPGGYHRHNHGRDPSPHQGGFYEPDYLPMMFKSPNISHNSNLSGKFPGASSVQNPAFGEDPADFFCSAFAPLDAGPPKLESVNDYSTASSSSSSLPCGFHPLQLEVPEIDECSMWMNDVLEDLPAVGSLQLPAAVSSSHMASFGLISSPSFSRSLDRPVTFSSPAAIVSDTARDSEATTPPPHPSTPAAIARTASAGTASPPSKVPSAEEEEPPRKNASTPKSLAVRPCSMSRKPKKVANADQLEHVRRERQRRDDMSFKIATLECLLPPAGPNLKRDRASIVHDSVHYVKALQQQVEDLKKTFSEMKATRQARLAATGASTWSGNATKGKCQSTADESSKQARLVEYHVQVEGYESAAILHKFRCRPEYMSRTMRVFEELNLDVNRSTITKMCNYTIVAINAKPRLSSNFVSPSAIVAKLRTSTGMS